MSPCPLRAAYALTRVAHWVRPGDGAAPATRRIADTIAADAARRGYPAVALALSAEFGPEWAERVCENIPADVKANVEADVESTLATAEIVPDAGYDWFAEQRTTVTNRAYAASWAAYR